MIFILAFTCFNLYSVSADFQETTTSAFQLYTHEFEEETKKFAAEMDKKICKAFEDNGNQRKTELENNTKSITITISAIELRIDSLKQMKKNVEADKKEATKKEEKLKNDQIRDIEHHVTNIQDLSKLSTLDLTELSLTLDKIIGKLEDSHKILDTLHKTDINETAKKKIETTFQESLDKCRDRNPSGELYGDIRRYEVLRIQKANDMKVLEALQHLQDTLKETAKRFLANQENLNQIQITLNSVIIKPEDSELNGKKEKLQHALETFRSNPENDNILEHIGNVTNHQLLIPAPDFSEVINAF